MKGADMRQQQCRFGLTKILECQYYSWDIESQLLLRFSLSGVLFFDI